MATLVFSKGRVTIDTFEVNEITLTTDVEMDNGFLVLTDQYFPGWKASIDGTVTKIYKVNGLVRGVIVPQGKHRIVFTYRFNPFTS